MTCDTTGEGHRMEAKPDQLDWTEVAPAVTPTIKIWLHDSELRWAEHAWATLAEAGLTSYTTEVERTVCVLRGVALGALYRDFSALAFDEGSPEDWREEVGRDLIGPFPLIDLFTLGQVVEREGYDVDHHSFDDGREIAEVLGDLVNAQYVAVVPELRRRMDDANLFASRFASHDAAVAYPLTKDQVSEIVNTHVTGNKMAAWEWLTQGRPFDV